MLKVEGVSKSYVKSGWLRKVRHQALSGISFEWQDGECLGIIGESGSGKSTLGRLLLGIEAPDRGTITFQGMAAGERRARRGSMSAVFQDYTSSMNPFYTVEQSLLEPYKLARTKPLPDRAKLGSLLGQVGLDAAYLRKYPHELSGGEAQRVCIARAISTAPKCILLDEAISSLDGSVQMQVLDLLKDLSARHRIGYIFITHDIQAAAYLCDRLMVIRHGQVVESVEVSALKQVQSAYTKELLSKIVM